MTKVDINIELTRIDNEMALIEMKDYWTTADRDRARFLSYRKKELLNDLEGITRREDD